MSIVEAYLVYDQELDHIDTFEGDEARERAEAYAAERAGDHGYPHGVMLAVPIGGTDLRELRAVTVYDENGREVFRSNAYDSELVPA